MKAVTETKVLKINTVYLNALNAPSTAHFSMEPVSENGFYKNYALATTIESPYYKTLLDAWNNKQNVKVAATFSNNYHLQKTEIFDVTGVEVVDITDVEVVD